MAEDKLATFKISADKWEAFKARAEQDSTNASALLKSLIDAYLEGRIDLNIDADIASAEGIDQRIEAAIDRVLAPKLQELEQRLGKLKVA